MIRKRIIHCYLFYLVILLILYPNPFKEVIAAIINWSTWRIYYLMESNMISSGYSRCVSRKQVIYWDDQCIALNLFTGYVGSHNWFGAPRVIFGIYPKFINHFMSDIFLTWQVALVALFNSKGFNPLSEAPPEWRHFSNDQILIVIWQNLTLLVPHMIPPNCSLSFSCFLQSFPHFPHLMSPLSSRETVPLYINIPMFTFPTTCSSVVPSYSYVSDWLIKQFFSFV